jgi:DNA repair protein RadC
MRRMRAESPARLNDPDSARAFLAARFGTGARTESLLVVHLDRSGCCVHVARYSGKAATVGLPIRRIIADALRLGSAGLVIAHNHPSGDCRPSDADYRATRKLVRAAAAIDLAVRDHLILGRDDWTSMRRMGLL